MRFTKLTQRDQQYEAGEPVYINFDRVEYMEELFFEGEKGRAEFTRIQFAPGASGDANFIDVMESPDDILLNKRFMGGDR